MNKFFLHFIAPIAAMGIFTTCNSNNTENTNNIVNTNNNAKDTSFFVESVTPQGEVLSTVNFPSIQVLFSEPVVTLKKLGEPQDISDAVTITPKLSGTFRWYGTSLLSFDCTDKLIPQKEYTITINPKLVSNTGVNISGELVYKFYTEELKLVRIASAYKYKEEQAKQNVQPTPYFNMNDIPPEYAHDVSLTFSNRVNPNVISKYIYVKDKNSAYKFKCSAIDEKTLLLHIKQDLPRNTEIKIGLLAGAIPDKDCISTSTVQEFSMHTLRPIELQNVDGKNNLSFRFNHKIKSGTEEKILSSISFKPQMQITKEQIKISGNCININDLPVTFNESYTVTLNSSTVEDVYNQTYESKITKKITVPNADSFAHFRDRYGAVLESQFEPKRAFEFQNVENGTYTITPICGVTNNYKPVQPRTFKIENSPKNKNRRVIQTVDLAPFLEKTSKDFRGALKFESSIEYKPYEDAKKNTTSTTKNYFQVTNLGVNVRAAWNEIVVLVTDLSTGEPIKNAQATLRLAEQNKNDERWETMLLGKGTKRAESITNDEGITILKLNDTSSEYKNFYYIDVTTEDDRVVTFINYNPISQNNVTHIFSDRQLYRPGETASIKIIDRKLNAGSYSTYNGNYEISFTENAYWKKDCKVYATVKSQTSEYGTASAEWKIPEDIAPGNYYITYKRLKNNSNDTVDYIAREKINVQFFERLRFEASAKITPITYIAGDTLTAKISASYLGGGSLAGGTTHSNWTRYETSFTPQGAQYKDYVFGPLLNNWYWRETNTEFYDDIYDEEVIPDNYYVSSDDNLSADGTAHISASTTQGKIEGAPYLYNLQSQVTDAGNQMIAARDTAIVHPASFYIGLCAQKKSSNFFNKNEDITFNYLFATPQGENVQSAQLSKNNQIEWTLQKKDWENEISYDEYGYEQSCWKEKIITENSGNVKITEQSLQEAQELTVTPKDGGQYRLTLKTEDFAGRKIVTMYSFYVCGKTRFFNGNENEIQLMPNKDEYEVGETAHILLNSTLPKGHYLVTVEREGIISKEVISLQEPSCVIDVPIKDEYIPIVYVSVSTQTTRTNAPPNNYDTKDIAKPSAIYGFTSLNISKKNRQFSVDVNQDKKTYLPGETAKINLTAKKDGLPVNGAELTLMVVDRGVLDLIDYHAGDPTSIFYAKHNFGNGSNSANNFDSIVDPVTYGTYTVSATLAERFYATQYMKTANGAMLEDKAMEAPMGMGIAETAAGGASQKIRKDFRATAVFLPSIKTDENGNASASFKLPDSLTEYVITVVGVKEQSFAYNETPLIVANPISVRDVETRILRPGDTGEAGVVITNIGQSAEDVTITMSVLSGLEKTDYNPKVDEIVKLPGNATIIGEERKTVNVKAGDTSTIMFNLNAQKDGWITLAFQVESQAVNEIIYKKLEIEKPYIYETVTTLGQIGQEQNSATEKIIFPSTTDDGRATFYLQLDATRLGTLRSAVNYVFRYPYGCLEQRSSRVLPLVAFSDYINVFGLESEVKDAKAVAQTEIASWASIQKKDGGFPYWENSNESDLAVSLRVAEIIALAKTHGIEISKSIKVEKLATYIENQITQLKKKSMLPLYAESYAYYVLSLFNKKIALKDLESIITNSNAGISEIAFAGLAAHIKGNTEIANKAAKKIKNCMSLTTRGASFQTSLPCSSWYFLNGTNERYALSLHLFTLLNPSDIYNAHLVWEILQLQKAGNGFWQSTATTSRMLIALDAYIKTNNLEGTDFSAQALLDGKNLMTENFKGVNATPKENTWRLPGLKNKNVKLGDVHYNTEWDELPIEVPFEKEVPIEFSKDGSGNLFYTISMTYAIPANEQTARDEGLCVYTEITDAQTGEVVPKGKLKSGKIYRQKVHITTTKERTFVAVRAPIPAGCEILNAAFVTTASVQSEVPPTTNGNTSRGGIQRTWWRPYSMSHQDIYDAEVRCFWNYLPIGNQSFEFLFRATRKGNYETPATLAECMYEPEIFGRSNGCSWKIE